MFYGGIQVPTLPQPLQLCQKYSNFRSTPLFIIHSTLPNSLHSSFQFTPRFIVHSTLILPNSLHSFFKSLHSSFHTSLINDCKSQPRKLWQTINSLLHHKPPSALPTTTANITLTDCFSSFFTDKISKLHSSLGFNANLHSSSHTDPPSIPPVLDSFTSVTLDEIIKMILKSPDK